LYLPMLSSPLDLFDLLGACRAQLPDLLGVL
jgi:hypothetical protein